jgi:hypothetical protein
MSRARCARRYMCSSAKAASCILVLVEAIVAGWALSRQPFIGARH